MNNSTEEIKVVETILNNTGEVNERLANDWILLNTGFISNTMPNVSARALETTTDIAFIIGHK